MVSGLSARDGFPAAASSLNLLISNELSCLMTIAQAEVLKRDLTDHYVVVTEGPPELRRFVGLTGQVKTVNMNGRALVQFDNPVDISWYDIDPAYLTKVDAPQPKKKASSTKGSAAAPSKPKPAKGGKSPLEMAREQGAAKSGAADTGEKKLSPLELARQQGAAKTGGAEPADAGEKKLSPLELARQQGAAKPGGAQPAGTGDKQLSPLELARQQGPAKGDSAEPVESKAAEPAESGEQKLSPLELARMQGPAKPASESSAAAEQAASEEPSAPEEQSETGAPAAATSGPAATPETTEEILALARQQGAFKG